MPQTAGERGGAAEGGGAVNGDAQNHFFMKKVTNQIAGKLLNSHERVPIVACDPCPDERHR